MLCNQLFYGGAWYIEVFYPTITLMCQRLGGPQSAVYQSLYLCRWHRLIKSFMRAHGIVKSLPIDVRSPFQGAQPNSRGLNLETLPSTVLTSFSHLFP